MIAAHAEAATFAAFVEGPSNRAAVSAARQVADQPAGAPNPLLLVGPAGSGKSHLLAAIGHTALGRRPPLRVERETPSGLVERARGGRGGLQPLHECDLLLIDDLEAIRALPDGEGILLELLLGRVPFGRQVVLAGTQDPATWGEAGEDLARVLAEGKVATLLPADPGTRLAILRHRGADLAPPLGDDVLAAIAAFPLGSVRELLAAMQRLVAFQAVSPLPIDAEQARLLIGGLPAAVPVPPEAPTPLTPATVPDALALRDDEFSSFLSEVAASVAHQVDRWRAQVGEAILAHGSSGFRTDRLEALLAEEAPVAPAAVIERFQLDVERLRVLEAEAVALSPELAGSPVWRDPDCLEAAEAVLAEARLRHHPLPGPSPAFRLDQFAEGTGNRQAIHAARQVIAQPGAGFNPLIIVGASGTGKSHLLHGLGHLLTASVTGPVACLAAGGLTHELDQAERTGGLAEWRSRYRQAAALLVDDLHLLRNQKAAQAELTDLVEHLLGAGRQVAMTIDLPPAAARDLDPRLLSRCESGLVVELPRPDRDIRRAIIKALLATSDAAGDAALADWLASRPAESVRAVQGMVHQVLSAAAAQGVAPSPALAREVVERGSAPPRRSAAHRAPGVTGPVHGVARSPEKMVLAWPRIADLLIEDLG